MKIPIANPAWHYFLKKQPWWNKYKKNLLTYRCGANLSIVRKESFCILLGKKKRYSVSSAFRWAATPEGYEYWETIDYSLPIHLPGEDKEIIKIQ